MGRDNSVGIATRYGQDGPVIDSQQGARFSVLRPEVQSASYTMGARTFSGVKRPGHGVDTHTPSSAEVKEREELYFYFPSGSSWPVLG